MFSVLGFAYVIRGKLSQKVGFKMFLFFVIGLSAAILYQLILSTQKLQNNLTGSKVEYMETDPNLNISISLCNSKLSWPIDNITELHRFDSIFQKGKEDTEWTEYHDTGSEMYIWEEKEYFVYLCKTMSFTADEVKIVHLGRYRDDAIFLHDHSFLTGGTSLKLAGHVLNDNNILLLKAKQIQRIEEENVCSSSIEFDSCRDDFIREEFNKTFGCIYFNMK